MVCTVQLLFSESDFYRNHVFNKVRKSDFTKHAFPALSISSIIRRLPKHHNSWPSPHLRSRARISVNEPKNMRIEAMLHQNVGYLNLKLHMLLGLTTWICRITYANSFRCTCFASRLESIHVVPTRRTELILTIPESRKWKRILTLFPAICSLIRSVFPEVRYCEQALMQIPWWRTCWYCLWIGSEQ